MRLTLWSMLVLLNSCAAPTKTNSPVTAAPVAIAASAPASQCTSCPTSPATAPVELPVVRVSSNAPSSRPVGRDVPAYTRAEVAKIIAGAEREKGDIAAQRDEARTDARLAHAYGATLEADLQRAHALPWIVGAASAVFGAAVAAGVTAAVIYTRQHSP